MWSSLGAVILSTIEEGFWGQVIIEDQKKGKKGELLYEIMCVKLLKFVNHYRFKGFFIQLKK